MKHSTLRIVPLAALVLVAACSEGAVTSPDSAPAPVETSVMLSSVPSVDLGSPPAPNHLVVFKGNDIPSDLDETVAALGGSVAFVVPQVGFAAVSGLDDASAAALGARREVSFVELEPMIDLDLPSSGEVASTGGSPDPSIESSADPTTAFFFARQWHHRAIGADVAWAKGELGSSGVTVAILDTGIDYMYPDLVGRVDLSRSTSFVPGDDALVDAFFPGRHYVTDLHYHGTHVASTVSSNSDVVAGVTTQTTLIGVKVCSVFGSCPTAGTLAGIVYAADAGADVANLSLGGGFQKSEFPGFVSVINRTMNYARQKGLLVVVSAGNAASNLDHNGNIYATYCDAPNVACISATGPSSAPSTAGPWVDVDTPAPYTNYGRSAISVAAPGGAVIDGSGGFVWQACAQTSLQIPVCQTGVYTLGITGTSMASPHAAGVAAILAQGGKSATALRSLLQQTSDDLGQRGADPFFGKGRVNAATAASSH